MIGKFLRFLFTRIIKHPMIVLAVCLFLTVGAMASMLFLNIETDIISLLPSHSPVAATLEKALSTYRDFDFIYVLLQSTRDDDGDTLIRAAESLAPVFETPAYIYSVEYKFDPRLLDLYATSREEYLTAILGPSDMDALLDCFTPDKLKKGLKHYSLISQSFLAPHLKKGLLEDPLNINHLFRRRIMQSRGPSYFTMRRGYFLSSDERMLIMVLRPLEPASNLRFSTKLMNFLNQVADVMIRQHDDYNGLIQVSFIGPHVETVASTRTVRNDLILTLATSFVGVLLLFMLVFKRREALLIVGIPLLVGIIWTLGLTQLVLGRLTVITFAFGAVLIGLGIDFSIHIYNRYLEEYAPESGVSVYRALHTALVRTGEGVLLGALTTAVAFYAMFFTSFRGFREMGFVAGSGILCCLLSVFLLLPILIPFVAPRAKGGTSPRMVNFALPRLYRLVSEYPRLLIIFGLVLTVYFSFHARFVSFEKDIGALKQPSKKYRDLHEQVITEFSLPTHQIIAIVRDDTLQGALEKNDRLYENIMSETRYPVLSCDTLRAFLPSIKTQNDSRRTFLERVGEKMPRLRERMLAEARTAGLSDESLEPFLERLERMVSSSRLQGQYLMYEDLRDPFMIRQVQNYLVKQGRVYKIMTRIFPQPGEWDAGVPADFLADISRGVDSIEFTGSAIVAQEIQRLIRRDLAVIMLLVTVSVFLILLLYFGILHKAVLAMFPVVCGCIWMLGTIRLLNIDLNFLNVVVIPMIIGVGVDNGIHLMQRFYESSHIPTFRDLQMSLVRTGRALVMTSLTTMVGFGSLAFADFRGIREMGLLSIFGISYTLVAALVILTAFLHVWSRRGRFWDIIGRENGEIR